MSGVLVFVAIAVLAVGAWIVLQQLKWAAACRAGAAKLHAELSATYAGEHRFRIAEPADFPDVDPAGYRDVASRLSSAGFVRLGAIEDETVTEIHPEHRTYAESHVAEDGSILASTYAIGGMQIVDLVTPLEDGRILMTTTAVADKLTPPPAVLKTVHAVGTPVEVLLADHRERLAAFRPAVRPVPVRTLEDALAAARHHSRVVADFRRSRGLVTEEEMLALASGEGEEPTARRVFKEIQRLRREAGRA